VQGTTGPFGGAVGQGATGAFEAVPSGLARVAVGQEGAALSAEEGGPERAALVPVEVVEVDEASGRATWSLDLAAAPPALDDPSRARALAALADVGASLERLHAAGRAHGDLRPAVVRAMDDHRTALLVPARAVDAGRLLAERLRAGAAPDAVAYAAPEVVAGGAGDAAADVYALAALAYRVLAGRPPLGQLELGRVAEDAGQDLSAPLSRALSADPTRRPSAAALGVALRAGARALIDLEAFSAPMAPATPATTTPQDATPGGPEDPLVKVVRIGAAARPPVARLVPPGAPDGAQRSAILTLGLIVGGVFVLTGAISLGVIGWAAMGDAGRAALLFLLTLGVLGAGGLARRNDYERTGLALLAVGSQLLWADAAYVLEQADALDRAGAWTLAASGVFLVTWALALRRGSAFLATIAAGDLLIALTTLGAYLSTNSPTGPPVWMLVMAVVAGALGAASRAISRSPLDVPFGVTAGALAWASAVGGAALLASHGHAPFGTGWPYGVLAAVAVVALLRAPPPHGTIALLAGAGILLVAPTEQALVRYDSLAYLQLDLAVGVLVTAAAFHLPWAMRAASLQAGVVLLGLVDLLVAPAILCLGHCGGHAGADLLSDALATHGQVADTPFVYLSIVVGLSAGLVGLGFLFARRAAEKTTYRLLEGGGVLLFFGVLTLLSLLSSQDWLYPGVLFGGGLVLLALGVAQERAALVAGAAAGLILNAWIQYFAKLHEVLPTSLLLIGFGLSVLGGGFAYERKVKALLPRLREWG
jgi:hypothetical protein